MLNVFYFSVKMKAAVIFERIKRNKKNKLYVPYGDILLDFIGYSKANACAGIAMGIR